MKILKKNLYNQKHTVEQVHSRSTWGLFQLGVKQEKNLLKPKFKQESVTFMPPNKEVEINNIKPFPVNWT